MASVFLHVQPLSSSSHLLIVEIIPREINSSQVIISQDINPLMLELIDLFLEELLILSRYKIIDRKINPFLKDIFKKGDQHTIDK